jgi:hypothetical protein
MTRLLVGLLALIFASAALAQSAAEKRAEIRKMRSETLAKLYKYYPNAKGKIASAYGYAVFSNGGINLIFASLAAGRGVARDNKTGKDIFMKMGSAGIGLGLGIKDGWEGGAHADAVAKGGGKGGSAEGAITVSKDMELYQLTETGLALEATIQGTKYFKDDDLNGK